MDSRRNNHDKKNQAGESQDNDGKELGQNQRRHSARLKKQEMLQQLRLVSQQSDEPVRGSPTKENLGARVSQVNETSGVSPSITVKQATTRKVLDNRYLLKKTIGHGRYAKVLKAVDLNTQQEVAVKILKVKEGQSTTFSKYLSLDCLYSEINILAACNHPNIVKIKAASFDGTIVKELVTPSQTPTSQASGSHHGLLKDNCMEMSIEQQLRLLHMQTDDVQDCSEQEEEEEETRVLKRKGPVCYYVMKLAEYGEMYRLIEMNERLSDDLVRYLFIQLIQGLDYLHSNGFVHRDIKPENLLLDRKGRLIIADFNFATPLKPMPQFRKPMLGEPQSAKELGFNNQQFIHQAQLSDKLASNQASFEPMVSRDFQVGSEAYNAPELWDLESQREIEQEDHDESHMIYNGVKADIFSSAATLFLMTLKLSPFRRAQIKDPYYKRLCKDKRVFWKIYSNYPSSPEFKDLFEKMSFHEPERRISIQEILHHPMMSTEGIDSEAVLDELVTAFHNVQGVLGHEMQPFTDEVESAHHYNADPDTEEQALRDDEQFEKLRQNLIGEVDTLSQKLRHQQNIKKISKEAMRNMIAGPAVYFLREYKKESRVRKCSMADSQDANASDKPYQHKNSNAGAVVQPQQPTQTQIPLTAIQSMQYHSDEERSLGSNDSGTLAEYALRARRTSSFNNHMSDEEEE